MRSGKFNLVSNSLTIFSAQIFLLFISTVTTILLARLLGPAGKGAFSLITLIPWILVEFGSLGLGTSIVYFIGQRKYKLTEIANNAWTFAILWGIVLMVLTLLLSGYISALVLKGVNPWYLAVVLLTVPLWLINSYFNFVLLAKDHVRRFTMLSLMRPVLFVCLLLASLFLGRVTLWWAVLAWVIAAGLTALVSVGYVRKLTPLYLSFKPNLIRDALKYGLKAHLGAVLLFFNYRFDVLLVGIFLNVTQVGLYSVAVAMAEVVWQLPTSIGLALFPKVSSTDLEESNRIVPVVLRNTIFLALLACFVFAVLGREIILITVGPKFLPSLPALWFLLPGVLVFSASKVLISYFNGCGRPLVASFSGLVSLIVMIVLDVALIPRWGISGAALASSIAYAVFTAVMFFFFAEKAEVSLRESMIIRVADLKMYCTIGMKGVNGWRGFFADTLTSIRKGEF